MNPRQRLFPSRRVAAYAVLSIGTAAVMSGCTPVTPAPGPVNAITLKECRVPGIDTAVKCATVEVYENRETKQGRKIGLNVVVLPASSRVKHPDPIFVFAGGPGQAATDLAAQANAMLSGLTSKRDIVLIDQRGTGKSNPLNCPSIDPRTEGLINREFRESLTRKSFADCKTTLEKRADLSLYSTTIAMADYNEVRERLGYATINLWGGSYGTRTALEYLRRYSNSVRSVVIDSVAPPSLVLPRDFSRDAGNAFEAMLAACEKDAQCAKSYPTLRADIDSLLNDLARSPKKVSIADPRTGAVARVDVNHEAVLMALFSSLYVPTMSAVLPAAIQQAKEGRFDALFALSSGFAAAAEEKMAMGMRLSVSCTEDVPRITRTDIETAEKLRPFGAMFIREFQLACENWPQSKLPNDFLTPVVSDKPVLIYSGGVDPVTPTVWGEEAKRTLKNSLHVVAPNVAHISSGSGCASKLTKQFIDKASIEGIDTDCMRRIPRPSFFEQPRERTKRDVSGAKDAGQGDGK